MKTKKLIFAVELITDYEDKKMLNGFQIPEIKDVFEKIKEDTSLKTKLFSESVNVKLFYNMPNDTLYLLANVLFNEEFNENDDMVLKHILITQIYKEEYSLPFGDKTIILKPTGTENILYRTEHNLVPKDFLLLRSVLTTAKDHAMYEDFMRNPIVFKQLKKLCELKGFPTSEDASTGFHLPIHRKDPNTGVVYLYKNLLQLFKQFQLAQNFLQGFAKDTFEYEMGKLMLARQDFAYDVWNLLTSSKPDQEIKIHKIEKLAKKCLKKHPLLDNEIEELEKSL